MKYIIKDLNIDTLINHYYSLHHKNSTNGKRMVNFGVKMGRKSLKTGLRVGALDKTKKDSCPMVRITAIVEQK